MKTWHKQKVKIPENIAEVVVMYYKHYIFEQVAHIMEDGSSEQTPWTCKANENDNLSIKCNNTREQTAKEKPKIH